MYSDPILDELRKIRDTFAKKYHYDLNELFQTLMQTERLRIKKENHMKRARLMYHNSSRREKISNT